MSRLIRKPAAFLSFAALLVIVPLALRHARSVAASAWPPAPILADDLGSALLRAGLDAEALAAAGVSPGSVPGIVAAFKAAMEAEPTRLSSADADYANARREADRLRLLVESGKGSAQDVASYQNQMQALASATAARQSALDAFRSAATAGLQVSQTSTLATLKGNRKWELPVEFLVIDRPEPEWVAVRDALTNERVAAKRSEAPNASQQALLALWRAQPAVALAKASREANLAACSSAWNAAMAP